MDSKVCSKCGIEKDISCFKKSNCGGKYGVVAFCKSCGAIIDKEYREKNKKAVNERRRVYTLKTKEKKRDYDKRYREENKEKIKERSRRFREENKERIT